MPGPTMTESTGRKAIDLFVYLAQGGKTIEFTFTGGEPLLAFSTLEELTIYADRQTNKAGMQPFFVLKTNGTILDRSIIDFLRVNRVKVVVSIDGNPSTHDRHRRTSSGLKTHSIVCRNLLTLQQNDIQCVASVTVHPDTCELVGINVQYLHSLGCEHIDIGPVYGTAKWTTKDCHTLAQALMHIASYIRETRSKGFNIDVGPLYRDSEHVRGVLSDRWGCHAASTNLAFLPNGQVAGCSALAMIVRQFPELILGDIFSGLNQQAVDHMVSLAQTPEDKRPLCQGCDVARNCTGGCLAINLATNRTALVPPALYCTTIAAIPTAWHQAWAQDDPNILITQK